MSATVSLSSTASAQTCTVERLADGAVLVVQPGPPGADCPLTAEFASVHNRGQRITLSPALAAAVATVVRSR